MEYIELKIKEMKENFENDEDKDSNKLINGIIEFKAHVTNLWSQTLYKNKVIEDNIAMKMRRELSQIQNFPQHLAGFVDQFIVKNGKEGDSVENQRQIENIFNIIDLTAERDIFLYYFEATLKDRLLSVNNHYEDVENEFVKRINNAMGEARVIKMKGMLQDISNSKKFGAEFSKFCQQKKKQFAEQVNLDIMVLTKSLWPEGSFAVENYAKPGDLEKITKEFEVYFLTGAQGQGKKIDWILSEGYVELKADFAKGKKNIILSALQYSILALLDNAEGKKMTLGEVKEKTGLKQIVPHLQPLVVKGIVSRTKDKKSKLSDSEEIFINEKFISKTR
jgi:hypothetical protein